MRTRYLLACGLLAGVMHSVTAAAQPSLPSPALAPVANRAAVATHSPAATLDSLVALALAASPSLRAAQARVDAAQARVAPASAPPDPMLMLGIVNQPLGTTSTGGPEPMTMRMIGVRQALPYPGKLALRQRAAEHELDAARASLDGVRRQVVRDVKRSYYELAFVDQALAIVGTNRDVLASFISLTEGRYGVGLAGQQDVIRARVEATRLAETAVVLTEQRTAALAQLDALLDHPGDAPIARAVIPERIVRAAVASPSHSVRFASASLGSRAADSPLRPLAELQDEAIRHNPGLRDGEAMIAAQAARAELARKASLPDVDLSLQYGQRGGGRPDMVTAMVSLPIPIFKGRKQDQAVAEAAAQLAALDAEHRAAVNMVRADVARLVSEVERERTRLALSAAAILPQSRAALASALASYQVGKVEFLSVLDSQSTVFGYETDYFRALSEFAQDVAELERIVGAEVLK